MDNVDKPLRTPDNLIQFPGQISDQDSPDVEIIIAGEEPIDTDAAGVHVSDSPENEEPGAVIDIQDFDGNLAAELSDDVLNTLSIDLMHSVDEDLLGREKWEQRHKDSLKYLGLDEEKRSQPWEGAAGVTHPMMLEAIVRYQSRALVKLYPPEGPAKLSIDDCEDLGVQVQIELARSQRKLNAWIAKKMPEHRLETDRLLFAEAQIGFAVKKIYYHNKLKRIITQFVKAEDFIMPYGCDNLETCGRYTEQVRRSKEEVKSLQRSKVFRDIPLTAGTEVMGDLEEAKSDINGLDPSISLDESLRFYEIHVDLLIDSDDHKDGNGEPSPYIVTIEKESGNVFSIKRNWREDDKLRLKRICFVTYIYVPGDGSYGYGIVSLTGQLAASATKLLRQLVDAGTLANLPALFKAKAARMMSQEPMAPGEIRDVEISAEELQKAFYALPFKEPSTVLFQLMELIVGEGKSFASTADLDISASSQNAPVGTTLALLERQTEVSNAVQSRLHDSFRRELILLVDLLREYQPDVYDSIFGKLEQIAGQNVSVCPVGDPTSATLSQRLIQLQAVAMLAQQSPQVYDIPTLHRMIVSAMGVTDVNSIIPDKSQAQPMNPVEENMAVMTGKPIQAFEFQDHKSHIAVHAATMQDPYYQKMLGQSPQGSQMMSEMQSHIAQHLAFDFHQQIGQQLGCQLPPLGQPQPPQVEAALSSLMAQAAQKLSQLHASQAQQEAAQKQQADPAYQLERAELSIKQQDVQQRGELGKAKLALEAKSKEEKNNIEIFRIKTQAGHADAAAATKVISEAAKDDRERHSQAIDIGTRLLDHKEHASALESQEKQAEIQSQNQPEGQ